MITGVPVRYWIELRKPIRKAVERYLEGQMYDYGDEVRVTFFSSGTAKSLVYVAFDCNRNVRRHRSELLTILMDKFYRHSKGCEGEMWYLGIDIACCKDF